MWEVFEPRSADCNIRGTMCVIFLMIILCVKAGLEMQKETEGIGEDIFDAA